MEGEVRFLRIFLWLELPKNLSRMHGTYLCKIDIDIRRHIEFVFRKKYFGKFDSMLFKFSPRDSHTFFKLYGSALGQN